MCDPHRARALPTGAARPTETKRLFVWHGLIFNVGFFTPAVPAGRPASSFAGRKAHIDPLLKIAPPRSRGSATRSPSAAAKGFSRLLPGRGPKRFSGTRGFFFMHHQRTELLFLALISIFNFLLPHFSCFAQLAFPSTAPGTGRAAAPCRWPGSAGRLAAGLCPWSTRTHSVPLSTTKPQDLVKNEVPGLAPM